MKKIFLSVIMLSFFILCGCYSKDNQKQTTEIDEPKEEILLATDENFIKIMTRTDEDSNYEIDCKIEGNFTNSGHKEILVFFNGKPQKHNESRFWDARVFIVDDENIILNVYDLYYRPLPPTPPKHLHIKEIRNKLCLFLGFSFSYILCMEKKNPRKLTFPRISLFLIHLKSIAIIKLHPERA